MQAQICVNVWLCVFSGLARVRSQSPFCFVAYLKFAQGPVQLAAHYIPAHFPVPETGLGAILDLSEWPPFWMISSQASSQTIIYDSGLRVHI